MRQPTFWRRRSRLSEPETNFAAARRIGYRLKLMKIAHAEEEAMAVTPFQDLPLADRTAHLLLALREDEAGFATVANLAFAGAVWRLRRRLPPNARQALLAAAAGARAMRPAAS